MNNFTWPFHSSHVWKRLIFFFQYNFENQNVSAKKKDNFFLLHALGKGGKKIKNTEKTIFRKISAEMKFFEVQFRETHWS